MSKFKLVALFVLALALGACGGGGSSSPGVTPPPAAVQPKPVTTYGKLTGFGSVYVNGVEYETDTADYDVNGRQGIGDDDFSVGMVVTVKGSVNPDGVTGTAESVSYDEEIEGPVISITNSADPTIKTISVFGVLITLDNGTKFEAEADPAFGFSTIAMGDNVQVSGVFHGATLAASYIEKQDASDNTYEVEGTVSLFDGMENFTLTLSNGSIIDVTLSAAGATLPAAGIVDGQYVEVEGTIPDPVVAPNAMSATKVELQDEDHFDDQDDEIGIKGPLTLTRDLELMTDTWSIDGTEVSFSASTEYEPANLVDSITNGTADGIIVKVEGSFVNGVLQADEVSNEDDSIELKAVFDSVADGATAKSGTITVSFGGAVGTLDVIVGGTTFFMDDDAMTPFDLTMLPAGTVLEIDGKQNATGDVMASKLGIDDGMGIEIAGPVEEFTTGASIKILGIVFTIDPLTEFPDGEPGLGVTASIEDTNGDGTAEKIEIDD